MLSMIPPMLPDKFPSPFTVGLRPPARFVMFPVIVPCLPVAVSSSFISVVRVLIYLSVSLSVLRPVLVLISSRIPSRSRACSAVFSISASLPSMSRLMLAKSSRTVFGFFWAIFSRNAASSDVALWSGPIR